MTVDPGTITAAGTAIGAAVAAVAAFFKSKENGGKLNDIHVLVDGNYSQLQTQVADAEARAQRLEQRMDELMAMTRLAAAAVAQDKNTAAALAETTRVNTLEEANRRIAELEARLEQSSGPATQT